MEALFKQFIVIRPTCYNPYKGEQLNSFQGFEILATNVV